MAPVLGRGFALLLASVFLHAPETVGLGVVANPIRKVVLLLQKMQEKVKQEAADEQAAFDKFMCYCKTSGTEVNQAIEEGKAKIDALTTGSKATGEKLESTKEDLAKHEASRTEAKESLAEATGIRDKEAAEFAAEKAEMDTNLAAMTKAIASLEKGMGGSFLQTRESKALRNFIINKAEMEDGSRQMILGFLQGTEDYAPASGEITGILKQMKDTMSEALAEATADEQSAIAQFDSLSAAKTKEIGALTAQIEEEMLRIGELGVQFATEKNELEDCQEQLKEDLKFSAELTKSCNKRGVEYEEIRKVHADEQVALGETIKMLNSDDALELFKKTLPSAGASSFLQLQVTSKAMRAQALEALQSARHRRGRRGRRPHPELDLVALALHGKQRGFEKVTTMIDDMIANLKTEQTDDDNKKEYCTRQLDISEDKKKELELSISDTEAAMEELEGSLAELKEETKSLAASIKALDKSVEEATALRKADNTAYKELMASDGTAKELILKAKDRMNQFYNPKLAKAAVLAQEAEQRQMDADDGDEDPDASSEGAADPASFVQVASKQNAGGVNSKQDSSGVFAMMDLLVADLDKEMTEAKVEEKDAQAEYEKMMEEAASKRAADAKALTEREADQAETQSSLETEKGTKKETSTELTDEVAYISQLHSECDFLLKYYDVRKEGRSDEIDALSKAKAVLSGADYSFLQLGRRKSHVGRAHH